MEHTASTKFAYPLHLLLYVPAITHVIPAMALQAGMLEENPSWEKLEAWLRSSRGQLPMLVVFETAEDVLIHEDTAEARYIVTRS